MEWEWLSEFLKGMVKPAAATAVVLLAAVLSYFQKLKLEGEMVYAIVRAFIQLSVIGFVLRFIFNQNNVIWILLAYLFMVYIYSLILFFIPIYNLVKLFLTDRENFTDQNQRLFQVSVAGYTAGQRAKHVPHGKYIAGASIMVGTSITMLLLVLLKVFPFTPQYIIPVAGMMVGNAMTVTGVTMKRLRDDIRTQMNLVSIGEYVEINF